jgi:hypothetical protein
VSAFLRLDLPLLLLLLLNRGLPWKLADCWRRAYLQWVGHQKVLLGALPELFSRAVSSFCESRGDSLRAANKIL